jgi:hypothetical protein
MNAFIVIKKALSWNDEDIMCVCLSRKTAIEMRNKYEERIDPKGTTYKFVYCEVEMFK